MSPSVLNQRIGELRDAGIIEHSARGYHLTAEGERLLFLDCAPRCLGEALGPSRLAFVMRGPDSKGGLRSLR